MLLKTFKFIFGIVKALIMHRLTFTGSTTFKIRDTDSEDQREYKYRYNKILELKQITGISNSWSQEEIFKICDKNADVPEFNYFSSFDGYLKKDKDNKLIFDEDKLKFNKTESRWAYGIFSTMAFFCVILFFLYGFTRFSGVFIIPFGVMGFFAFIGCLMLSPPSDRKIQEAKKYIHDYYVTISSEK